MIWYLVVHVSRVIIIVVNIVHMPTAVVFSGA
jgi:hypothetical protein